MKSKLQLENFSVKTGVSVRQDFYATACTAGFAMICAADATKQIQDNDQGTKLKYARKDNLNRAIACLRNRFFLILPEHDPHLRRALSNRLSRDIAAYPGPIRTDRSPARNNPRSKHFYINKKPVLP